MNSKEKDKAAATLEKQPSINRKMVIYIASPYSVEEVDANVQVQVEAAHRIMDLGHAPIVPLLSHLLESLRHRPYVEWLNADLEIVSIVDIVLRLPGESAGADQEVELAHELGIAVAFGWDELLTRIARLR